MEIIRIYLVFQIIAQKSCLPPQKKKDFLVSRRKFFYTNEVVLLIWTVYIFIRRKAGESESAKSVSRFICRSCNESTIFDAGVADRLRFLRLLI